MPSQVRAVILCEDRQQEVFARTFLVTCGIQPVRVEINPNGSGSAEQYVREKYPVEVRTFRSKFNAQLDTRLVVMTDADKKTVQERFQSLDHVLQQNGLPTRQSQERIGVFIPKRNIETWIYFLKGRSINEEDAYPKLKQESDCKPEVEALARNRHTPLPNDAPPSMSAACQEIHRIL